MGSHFFWVHLRTSIAKNFYLQFDFNYEWSRFGCYADDNTKYVIGNGVKKTISS